MATQFSYDVIKSIIGHLPSETRIQIAKFCPTLKCAERKSPLHLEVMQLHKFYVQVDWLTFEIRPTDQLNQGKGDFSHVKIHRNGSKNLIYDAPSPKTTEEMWKKYLDFCLGNRGTIKVDTLICKYFLDTIPNLPKGLKIECKKLELAIRQLDTIRKIKPFLTTPFPERVYISFDVVDDLFLEEELVKQAEALTIRDFDTSSARKLELLAGLRNEQICVKSGNVQFKPEHFMKMAESWLVRCPDLKTQFVVEFDRLDYLLNIIDFLKVNLGAVQIETVEKDMSESLRQCFTILMRSGHELNIFGGKIFGKSDIWLLGLIVMEKRSDLTSEDPVATATTPAPTQSTTENSATEKKRERILIATNVPESTSQFHHERLVMDVQFLESLMKHLNIVCEPVEIHRIGRPRADGHPRPLKIVMPSTYFQRLALSRAKSLRSFASPRPVYINPYMTHEQRKEQYEKRLALRNAAQSP